MNSRRSHEKNKNQAEKAWRVLRGVTGALALGLNLEGVPILICKNKKKKKNSSIFFFYTRVSIRDRPRGLVHNSVQFISMLKTKFVLK